MLCLPGKKLLKSCSFLLPLCDGRVWDLDQNDALQDDVKQLSMVSILKDVFKFLFGLKFDSINEFVQVPFL